jgi:hypothetical protein
MKIYEIAMFCLCFNVSVYIINGSGLVPTQIPMMDNQWNVAGNGFNDKVPTNLTYDSNNVGMFTYGDNLRGIAGLFYIIKDAPTMATGYLYIAGVTGLIVEPIRYILWAVYLVGIVQLFAKWQIERSS